MLTLPRSYLFFLNPITIAAISKPMLIKSNAKHDKANFEYFTVKARKGKRNELKAHVEKLPKPLNTWLLEAIEEKLQRDNETKKDCQE